MTFESTDTERPVQRMDILDKLTEVGRADAVFSAPVSNGDYVVITASETMVGLGFGFGSGKSNGETGEGGGGGGFGVGRPVAVIVVRADEI